MQALTSRLIRSTIEISGDLIDPAISQDAKTTYAVEALLDHLDAMSVLLEEEIVAVQEIGMGFGDEETVVEESGSSQRLQESSRRHRMRESVGIQGQWKRDQRTSPPLSGSAETSIRENSICKNNRL